MPFQGLRERCRGSRAMRMLGLPVVTELPDCSLLALRNEDRVETEAARSSRLVGDAPFQDAGATKLLARGRERD
jgi:hypothetical protein